MQDYSQHEEQPIILNYFGNYKGNFLDIGANDGVTFSNVYALVLNGWGGVSVEASPKAFERLLSNYDGYESVVLANVAIGAENGEADFYESGDLLGGGDVGLVSSLKIDETTRWKTVTKPEHKVVSFEKIRVPVVDFKSLMETSLIKKFEFVSIDIEGGELDVLPQMDFNELGTQLLCVENNGRDKDKFDAIILPFGFKLIHENRANLIYGR